MEFLICVDYCIGVIVFGCCVFVKMLECYVVLYLFLGVFVWVKVIMLNSLCCNVWALLCMLLLLVRVMKRCNCVWFFIVCDVWLIGGWLKSLCVWLKCFICMCSMVVVCWLIV